MTNNGIRSISILQKQKARNCNVNTLTITKKKKNITAAGIGTIILANGFDRLCTAGPYFFFHPKVWSQLT